MKVLQINSVCGIGSTGRIATDIDKFLKEHEYESFIAYGRDISRNCDTTIKIGNQFDNYMHVAKTRLFDKHGFGSTKATREFIDKAKILDPDVVHLHNIHGYYINIELLFDYLKQSNKPVVWTLHDCWAFTGHCSYFDYVDCERWQNGCYACPQNQDYPTSIYIDHSKWNYQKKKEIFSGVKNMTIVTPSKWLAGLVKKSFLHEYPLQVINNGIDLTTFQPVESNFREKFNLQNKFIILGVASVWSRRKGLEYFIELSRSLEEVYQIVLVGLTERQKKQLPATIIGITKTNNTKELAELYSAADVFINPTLEDNFPTTNLEALACGTPEITFDTGGSVETINEKCGYVVEKGNTAGLLYTIEMIREKGKKHYTEECIKRANAKYNKNNRYENYMELYKKIVE